MPIEKDAEIAISNQFVNLLNTILIKFGVSAIKSAASAASIPEDQIKGTKTQGSAWATARHADGRARGALLGFGSLDLVFGPAALTAYLIKAGREFS